MSKQVALAHGPGKHHYLVTVRSATTADVVRMVAATLIDFFQRPENSTTPRVFALVALQPAMLVDPSGSISGAGYTDCIPKEHEFKSDDIALLVQIAADSEDAALFARRAVRKICEPLGSGFIREHGGRGLLGSREPFGYRDGSSANTDNFEPPTPAHPVLAEGCWLLYQQFITDIEGFHERTVDVQNDIVGRARHGRTHNGQTNSHIRLQSAGTPPRIVRRGFRFRFDDGREGLSFLGLAAAPADFTAALERMIGPTRDALLDFIDPLEGAVFFVPPGDPSWLEPSYTALNIAIDALEDLRPPVPVVDYVVTRALLQYVEKLRDLETFGPAGKPEDMDIQGEVAELMHAFHHFVTNGKLMQIDKTSDSEAILIRVPKSQMDTTVQELDGLLQKIRDDAKKLNGHYGEYLTLVI